MGALVRAGPRGAVPGCVLASVVLAFVVRYRGAWRTRCRGQAREQMRWRHQNLELTVLERTEVSACWSNNLELTVLEQTEASACLSSVLINNLYALAWAQRLCPASEPPAP
jgi:hypothetical protein